MLASENSVKIEIVEVDGVIMERRFGEHVATDRTKVS
jgi:hypothetical protein